jgi:CheY-like chemotaxis protein
VGVLNVESDQPGAFKEEDRQFAEILANYIAMALHILQLLVIERSHTVGQVASDVLSEIATPLSEITAEASSLIQDYLNDTRLRKRLNAIVENVDRIKNSVQAVSRGGVTGLIPERNVDPVIGGKRVLIAEDEDVIRDTICEVLSRLGAAVDSARDGESAIQILSERQFDVVLSDIKMPLRSGYEVFAVAKKTSPDAGVILITGFGYDPDHTIVRANKEGLAGVLFKPFKVDKLIETVRSACGAAPAEE